MEQHHQDCCAQHDGPKEHGSSSDQKPAEGHASADTWLKRHRTITMWQAVGALVIAVLILLALFDIRLAPRYRLKNIVGRGATAAEASPITSEDTTDYASQVLPLAGFTLPIRWGDLGKRLIEQGVIDQKKLEQIYASRGGLAPEDEQMFSAMDSETLTINAQNSGFLLNMFWALGLANKNDVLDKGPMQDPQYGGAGGFASTGGWTLAKGKAMDHYSKHRLITLTADQQALVERVSKNIYRPCCGNSTYFPDCNHGMAMLGLLELMASQGAKETDLYRTALAVNSFWFPETYATLAKYFAGRGVTWSAVDPQEVLGANYSSGSGYRQILAEIEPATIKQGSGGGCGV